MVTPDIKKLFEKYPGNEVCFKLKHPSAIQIVTAPIGTYDDDEVNAYEGTD